MHFVTVMSYSHEKNNILTPVLDDPLKVHVEKHVKCNVTSTHFISRRQFFTVNFFLAHFYMNYSALPGNSLVDNFMSKFTYFIVKTKFREIFGVIFSSEKVHQIFIRFHRSFGFIPKCVPKKVYIYVIVDHSYSLSSNYY